MEHASPGGGGGGGSNSPRDNHNQDHDHHRSSNPRLTSYQKQRLESMFNECPYTDERKRMELSMELSMEPQQVKFWFQNRRAKVKNLHEQQDNSTLKSSNEGLQCENIAIKGALKNYTHPNCGPPPLNEDPNFVDHQMRVENLHLKEKLDRMSSLVSKYIGKTISPLPSVTHVNISPLNLSMGTSIFGRQQGLFDVGGGGGGGGGGGTSSSLDLNLHQEASSSPFNSMPKLPEHGSISEMDKHVMSIIATNALEEFMRLLHTNEPLWIKSPTDVRDALNFETYERMYPKENTRLKNPNVCVEASRGSAFVMINSSSLVEKFMDPNEWKEIFAPIVQLQGPSNLKDLWGRVLSSTSTCSIHVTYMTAHKSYYKFLLLNCTKVANIMNMDLDPLK